MRKNLMTLVTLALVLVNLVLTGIMAFMIIPEVNKVNDLITKISSAIDLDISSNPTGSTNVSMESLQVVNLEDTMTINLKDSGDGKQHMAIIGITLGVNTNSNAYETYPDLTAYEGVIRTEVNNIVSQYTYEEITNNQQEVQDAIKDDLNELFGGDLIATVGFSTATFQ